ncbi:Glyceraldehyde-3-phosphate dehydrogenase-like protein [Trichinella spiralis]|uniref:Glyceraldehyde-3-phosphate dehydrogenase-like protein n=1 Tax=Trichinella spiralis TaxID=6334 RepID=A0ABR3KI94_TRISP
MGGLSDQSFQSVEGPNADSTLDTANANNSKLEMEVNCPMDNVKSDSTDVTQKSVDFFSDLRDEDFNFAFDGHITQDQSKNTFTNVIQILYSFYNLIFTNLTLVMIYFYFALFNDHFFI